jgi:hypothetical protein
LPHWTTSAIVRNQEVDVLDAHYSMTPANCPIPSLFSFALRAL